MKLYVEWTNGNSTTFPEVTTIKETENEVKVAFGPRKHEAIIIKRNANFIEAVKEEIEEEN